MITLPFFKKKEETDYFLALLLREEKITAVIFEGLSGKVRIVAKHEEYFETSIEDASTDEWLKVFDKAVSSVEANLPPNIETQKTVFGVKETWVEETKIKKEYLLKLKKISDALGLSPIGFMVIHEAIAHLIQKEEGVPVSAILIEVDLKNIVLSVLKAGKVIETKRAEIEHSIPQTTNKLLHHFTNIDVLPSRIIIFDGKRLEKISQEFICHQWSKSLPFLHVPRITVLNPGFDAKAVLFGAATQMGFEMIYEEGEQNFNFSESTSKISDDETPQTSSVNLSENENPDEETKVQSKSEKHHEIEEENFGFILDEDITQLKKENSNKDNEFEENEIFAEKQEGLLNNDHFEENQKDEDEEKEAAVTYALPITNKNNTNTGKNKKSLASHSVFSLNLIKNILFYIFMIFSKTHKIVSFIPFLNTKRIFVFSLIIILILVSSTALYFFGLRSTVTVDFNPKIVEKNQEILFTVDSSSDFSKNIVKGEYVSVSKEGTLSLETTGKKETGEKARGAVTFFSRLSEEKVLPSGSVITSSNDLEFTLDNPVTLASSSADASSDPTKVKVPVTAKNIGKEYNLPSNTKFTFGSIPPTTLVAKNESAFSGGSKKEIKVVDKKDLDKLLSKLIVDLEEKAKEDILKKTSSEKEILPIFVNSKFANKEFNKKAGEEASSLTLKGTVEYQVISYNKNNLQEYTKSLFEEDIKNQVFSKKEISLKLENIQKKSDKEITGTVKAKAGLLPKINEKKILSDIKGKSFTDARSILLELPQVSNVNIALSPDISFLPKKLPRDLNNIKLITNINE